MELISTILKELRALVRLEEIQILATSFNPPNSASANAHVHLPPNFSAFENIDQAVGLAAMQGVRVLGASNYYDYSIYGDFASAARRHGVYPLFGIEVIALVDSLLHAGTLVNDPGNPGRMYMCGKGITRFAPMTPEAKRLLEFIRENDSSRMRTMLERAAAIFARQGLPIKLDDFLLRQRIATRHSTPLEAVFLQERHLAQALQEELFTRIPLSRRTEVLSQILGVLSKVAPYDPARIQGEIRTHLMKLGKPAFVKEVFLDFDQSYRLILELGGIPCYPTLADGAKPVCAYEDPVEKLITELQRNQVHCAEFIPIRNKPEVLEHYVSTMRAAGFVITGGTEHNTPDLIPLEPTCLAGAKLPERIREIFWEGACVIAAHQFLGLRGLCGYVDDSGRLHPGFDRNELRIEYFRRLGGAVMQRYHKTTSNSKE